MPVSIQLTTNASAVLTRLRRMPFEMAEGIAAAINEQNERTVTAVITNRMNYPGKGPVIADGLRRQSGMAVKSVRTVPAEIRGNTISGSFGSNLKYVRAHEFGFTGTVNVRAHTRRRFRYGKEKVFEYFDVITRTFQQSTKRGRRVVKGSETFVKAHTMQMRLPARNMFRDTLAIRVPSYSAAISDAIMAAWAGQVRNLAAKGATT